MADALAQATDVPNHFQIGAAADAAACDPDLPDPAMPSPLLDTFGRCSRTAACAASPAPVLSLRQALLLIGGDVIEGKVSNLNGYLASALKLELEPEELVENLYYRTVCRPPTAEELSRLVGRAETGLVVARGGRRPLLGAAEFAGVRVQPLTRRRISGSRLSGRRIRPDVRPESLT